MRPPLTHAAVARQLHAKGYGISRRRTVGREPRAVCAAVLDAFWGTGIPLGEIPDTPDDCAEIRAELARLETEAQTPSPSETRH